MAALEPGAKIRVLKCATSNPFHEGRIGTVLAREPKWTTKADLVVDVGTKKPRYCEPEEWQSPEMPFHAKHSRYHDDEEPS